MRARASTVTAAVILLAAAIVPSVAADERTYVAQSLWSAKHLAGVDEAWLKARPIWVEKVNGAGVRVGVVSTGVEPGHPDVKDAAVLWRDFVNARPDPYDDHGYGTFLAGVVAGRGHLQWNPFEPYWITGARGVAPGAELVVAKAVRADGGTDDLTVARAIQWATDPNGDGRRDDGVDILLLPTVVERPRLAPSLSASLDLGAETRQAVERAVQLGVVVVTSAGNTGGGLVSPADIQASFTVGAVDRHGFATGFNNRGVALDLLAPGILVGPWPKELDAFDFASDGYASVAGTGTAAAFVAGFVALLLESDPTLRADVASAEEGRQRVDGIVNAIKFQAKPFKDLKPNEQGAGVLVAAPVLLEADRGVGALDVKVVVSAAVLAFGLVVLLVRSRLSRRSTRKAPPPEEDA